MQWNANHTQVRSKTTLRSCASGAPIGQHCLQTIIAALMQHAELLNSTPSYDISTFSHTAFAGLKLCSLRVGCHWEGRRSVFTVRLQDGDAALRKPQKSIALGWTL